MYIYFALSPIYSFEVNSTFHPTRHEETEQLWLLKSTSRSEDGKANPDGDRRRQTEQVTDSPATGEDAQTTPPRAALGSAIQLNEKFEQKSKHFAHKNDIKKQQESGCRGGQILHQNTHLVPKTRNKLTS
ncbi:hypothetical protein FQA47_002447 [Oryzias melastigma]|uniref:Uncharacterized protein n=1 Tax=Oryzias melastigma TaxID=30732 RepID=A0A834KYU5_ORYME|nr:hypothetical protein FQA47_002447 [Oryzias melastigma]